MLGDQNKCSKKQKVVEFGNYLTEKEVESLKDQSLTLRSKTKVVAGAMARMEVWYPSEPSYGACLQVLKEVDRSLESSEQWKKSLEVLKSTHKDIRKTFKPSDVEVAEYTGNPAELPPELFQRAFADSPPQPVASSSSMAPVGPLRKSHKDLKTADELPQWLKGCRA